MKEAFTYMFKDPRYNDKAMLYFIICSIALALIASPEIFNLNTFEFTQGTQAMPVTNPIFVILPFIGVLLNLVLTGYYFTCIQAITKQHQNYVLPFISFGSSFVKGLKLTLAVLLTSLILMLLGVVFAIAGAAGIALYSIIIIVLFLILGNAFIWLFANEGKFFTFFAWKKATKLILANYKTYFMNIFILFLLALVSIVISTILVFVFNYWVSNMYVAWILTSIEEAIIASYIAFVAIYLIAKSIKPETVV